MNERAPDTHQYPDHTPILNPIVTTLLAVLVTVVLIIGTLLIVGTIADNRDIATSADKTAETAQRAVVAQQRAEKAAASVAKQRRLDFARADYRTCLIDESQDRILAGILQAALNNGRMPQTPAEARTRRKFVYVERKLSAGRHCERLDVLDALSPAQRKRLIAHYRRP